MFVLISCCSVLLDALSFEVSEFVLIFILGSFCLGLSCFSEVLKSLCFPDQLKLFYRILQEYNKTRIICCRHVHIYSLQ